MPSWLGRRRAIVLMIALAVAGWLSVPSATFAQGQECFDNIPGITNCIHGRFYEYWLDNGGLPVFGYPITGEVLETTAEGQFTVQYFERNVFELHPENARPYDVQLGRLGDTRLQQLGRNWFEEPKGRQSPNCYWAEQTQHSICDEFADFWESHGLNDPQLDPQAQSLALFGLPLTEPRLETNSSGDTVLTQWFERARIEYHAADGTILLGLLGHEVLADPDTGGNERDYIYRDVEGFWGRTDIGNPYLSPNGVVEFLASVESACGPGDSFFYCPADETIYLELVDLERENIHVGDMAMVTIIAHEWGHHIQNLLGIASDEFYSIDFELQADCLAGAYAGDAETRGRLEEGDIEEALESLPNAGDPIDTPWDDPNAHGTSKQRQDSFLEGLENGREICIPAAGPPPPPPPPPPPEGDPCAGIAAPRLAQAEPNCIPYGGSFRVTVYDFDPNERISYWITDENNVTVGAPQQYNVDGSGGGYVDISTLDYFGYTLKPGNYVFVAQDSQQEFEPSIAPFRVIP